MRCPLLRLGVRPLQATFSVVGIFILLALYFEIAPAITKNHDDDDNNNNGHNLIVDIPSVNNKKLSSGIRHLRQQPNRSGLHDVPDDVTWVNGDGVFLDRIALYNDVIYNVSERLLANRRSKKWQSPTSGDRAIMVAGTSNDYLTKLASISTVTSVILAWSDSSGYTSSDGSWSSIFDKSNLLVQDYHPVTASESLCKKIRGRQPFIVHRYEAQYNHQCSNNISDAFRVTSLEIYFINALPIRQPYYWPNDGAAYPSNFYTDVPRLVTYMHIIEDGIVNKLGEVVTGKYKIIPYNCRPVFNNKVPKYDIEQLPLYTEVFSISQFWGAAFYHKNTEDFPKVAPYLQFLKRKPQVKIQVYETGSYTQFFLKTLGIDQSRLISGDVRAHVIYLPRGTSCGYAQIPETQLLSHHLRLSIPKQEDSTRNLVLIQRSRSRFFTQKKQIAEKLQILAKEYGLKLYLFKDNPVPSMEEVMREFNKAAIVVAPHGAGLSNLLFCPANTVVLEALCNPPHTNMCYTRMAHILGFRYYAVMSRGGCEGHIDVPAEEIETAVRRLLNELKHRKEI